MTKLDAKGPLQRAIAFALENRALVILALVLLTFWGAMTAPFDWKLGGLPRDPVPVDAIPDIGENQQIVFTEWAGRSPRDIEDQISYPLTVSLMGMPGVRTVRSYSIFGFSTLYVIFEDGVDFYWARSRILEKLASLPSGLLPADASPRLGPDATALGQVFWYTLEGRDEAGETTGGWSLQELRSIQDFQVKYALLSAEGVAEVASVGGFLREYQIDVDPEALRAWNLSLADLVKAVRASNLDVGARILEVNSVEYLVRGLGRIESVGDIENTVIRSVDGAPLLMKHVATVGLGPAPRRGALDKEGAEVVGGVVAVRYGENPLSTIDAVKAKIQEITPGLPSKILDDGRKSSVTIVPFYDRSGLIHETLGTLKRALGQEILVTVLVVLLMIMRLRASILIAGLLPLAVLMSFSAMKMFGVEANVVALSGIAIAIGTMVDMGIVIVENILRRMREAEPGASGLATTFAATREVSGAVLTSVSTTVISFLPVFTLQAAEGKLFKPLAYTKTFALLASAIVAILVIPVLARGFFAWRAPAWLRGDGLSRLRRPLGLVLLAALVILLARDWMPLGLEHGLLLNTLLVLLFFALVLGPLFLLQRVYTRVLSWCLSHKALFLVLPILLVLAGGLIGSDLGREFMPALDEGSFLYMPTTMPHASIGEALDILQKQDMGMAGLPEVESVVGKIGRAETSLDPAPISMMETVIHYRPEYLVDEQGRRQRFRFDSREVDLFRNEEGDPLSAPDGEPYTVKGRFERDEEGRLIPHRRGKPFRNWRPALDPDLNEGREAWAGVQNPDDIWKLIVSAGQVPGATSAPKLQPIQTRIVMLQSGMRAPLGIKIKGPDLQAIEDFGRELEKVIRQVPSIEPATVNAERMVGKPYLEIDIDRESAARYGISVGAVQQVIETAIGGKTLTRTLEGREGYPVRLRYARERRGSFEDLSRVLVTAPDGAQIPLGQLSEINYRRGPQVIKSEDGFLVGYLLFGKRAGEAEVDVVEEAGAFLELRIAEGSLSVPAGISYSFAGSYENQIRASARLRLVLPLALALIFALLYLQFRSSMIALLVFSGVLVAWSGGFLMLWLYGQNWFLGFAGLRELFHIAPVNLSVAVWVGFLALFGIATDDGVLMATYLRQRFEGERPADRAELRHRVVEGASRRVRPALMTTATTLLALLPILSSTGRGSDIMIPMAIPAFGGMVVAVLTIFVVPVFYSIIEEFKFRPAKK